MFKPISYSKMALTNNIFIASISYLFFANDISQSCAEFHSWSQFFCYAASYSKTSLTNNIFIALISYLFLANDISQSCVEFQRFVKYWSFFYGASYSKTALANNISIGLNNILPLFCQQYQPKLRLVSKVW